MCRQEQEKAGGLSLAVVGSRSFSDGALLASVLGKVRSPIGRIISGGARGADSLAEAWARCRGVPVRVHEAEWEKHGPMAGPLRNRRIVEEADALLAFWDGRSRGTADVVEKARAKGIPVHVVRFEPEAWQTTSDEATRRCVVLGFEETIERETPTVDEIAEASAERDEDEAYDRARTLDTVLAGDALDSVALRLLETDHGAKTAVVRRGEDKGPPEDKETGERKERRAKRPGPIPASKLWAVEGEIATVYPPSAKGAQLVVLVDGRKVILPKAHRVVRGGPLDRYRHVLRVKGWTKEAPAKDGRGTVNLVGPHAQVVEAWVPRFPREAAGSEADREPRGGAALKRAA